MITSNDLAEQLQKLIDRKYLTKVRDIAFDTKYETSETLRDRANYLDETNNEFETAVKMLQDYLKQPKD